MLKKYQKDIMEVFLISILWLAPAARGGYDYRICVAFVLYIAASLAITFIDKKGVVFVTASVLLIVACFVYDRFFFSCVAPVILLYTNKFYLKISINCIINIKIANIINMIIKNRSEVKYERTSNRIANGNSYG